jgi:glycosyltransferase involved in cell wall biosynthesis
MSVYNSAKFLPEAVESIINQTFTEYELIIIDDHSSDNSWEIINRFKDESSRIIPIRHNVNIGRAAIRNIALKSARGQYIAIMDSDDIAYPMRLGLQYEYLQSHPRVYLTGTGAHIIDEQGNRTGVFNPETNYLNIRKISEKRSCFYHSSTMFRNTKDYCYREKFNLAQDYDLFLRMISDNRIIINLSDVTIKYRLNVQKKTWEKCAKSLLYSEKAKEFHRQRLAEGKDRYESFNPQELESSIAGECNSRDLCEIKIRALFMANELRMLRKTCVEYFKKYGMKSKILLYWMLSSIGKNNFSNFRKILLRYYS